MSNLSPEEIGRLALRFAPEGVIDAPVPFGGGHINDTYLFSPAGEKGVRYVLQRINKTAFPHPEDVMDNMLRVTQHLRGQIVLRGGDPQRETLRLLRTQDGHFFAVDRNGDYWRSYSFVSDSVSYDRSGDERIFRESGRAFGRFLAHDSCRALLECLRDIFMSIGRIAADGDEQVTRLHGAGIISYLADFGIPCCGAFQHRNIFQQLL